MKFALFFALIASTQAIIIQKSYSNDDGQVFKAPASNRADPVAAPAIEAYEAQRMRFHHANVNAYPPNFGPKDGLDEKK